MMPFAGMMGSLLLSFELPFGHRGTQTPFRAAEEAEEEWEEEWEGDMTGEDWEEETSWGGSSWTSSSSSTFSEAEHDCDILGCEEEEDWVEEEEDGEEAEEAYVGEGEEEGEDGEEAYGGGGEEEGEDGEDREAVGDREREAQGEGGDVEDSDTEGEGGGEEGEHKQDHKGQREEEELSEDEYAIGELPLDYFDEAWDTWYSSADESPTTTSEDLYSSSSSSVVRYTHSDFGQCLERTPSAFQSVRLIGSGEISFPGRPRKQKMNPRVTNKVRRVLSLNSTYLRKMEHMGHAMGHVFEALSEGIIIFDRNRFLTGCNTAGERFFFNFIYLFLDFLIS